MTETAGLPFWEFHFDKAGKLLKHTGAIPPQLTDLFVFAHAWNNDYNDAKDLYQAFFEQLAQALVEQGTKPDIQIGVAGVFWPSMLWPGDEPLLETTGTTMFDPAEKDWSEQLKTAYDGMDQRAAIDRMRELVEQGSSDPRAIAEFRVLLRALAPEGSAEFEDLTAAAPELWDRAKEAIRLTAYIEVARRAILIGEQGLAKLLPGLPASTRVHLLGHGFGSGLVGAAAAGGASNLRSLFLMGVEENADAASALKVQPVFDPIADPLDPEVARAVLTAAGVV